MSKILLVQNENEVVVIGNAAKTALLKAQEAFTGAAKDFGIEVKVLYSKR